LDSFNLFDWLRLNPEELFLKAMQAENYNHIKEI